LIRREYVGNLSRTETECVLSSRFLQQREHSILTTNIATLQPSEAENRRLQKTKAPEAQAGHGIEQFIVTIELIDLMVHFVSPVLKLKVR